VGPGPNKNYPPMPVIKIREEDVFYHLNAVHILRVCYVVPLSPYPLATVGTCVENILNRDFSFL
jgi:hypothetical protein